MQLIFLYEPWGIFRLNSFYFAYSFGLLCNLKVIVDLYILRLLHWIIFMSNIVILMVTLQLLSGTGQTRLIWTRLIRSSAFFEVSVKCFPIISCLKCMVNSYFHLFRRKSLPTNDFELTVPDLKRFWSVFHARDDMWTARSYECLWCLWIYWDVMK